MCVKKCVGNHMCTAVCCSVLQCVAVCCSVLQCVSVCCSGCSVFTGYHVRVTQYVPIYIYILLQCVVECVAVCVAVCGQVDSGVKNVFTENYECVTQYVTHTHTHTHFVSLSPTHITHKCTQPHTQTPAIKCVPHNTYIYVYK